MVTITIDASALKDAACNLRAFRNVVLGLKEKGLNNDTHFGSCFHQFRSVYRTTGNADLAIHNAEKMWRDADIIIKDKKKYVDNGFLMKACMDYAEQYVHDRYRPVLDKQTGKLLVEPYTRFAFPFYADDKVEVLVAGTMDEVAFGNDTVWNGGSGYRIVDAKTSAAWNSYTYFNEYILNPQLLVYRWAIHEYALFKPDSIWAEIDKSPNVGCMIDGIFYKAGKANEQPTIEFKRSNVFTFNRRQVEEMRRGVTYIVKRLVESIHHWIETGEEPYRDGVITNLCNESRWGVCKYCYACSGPDRDAIDARLEEGFIKREYNPMTHGEMKK